MERELKILEKYKIRPISIDKNILQPTAVMKNDGPALVQKQSKIDASFLLISLFFTMTEMLLAAEGYPPIIPTKNKSQNFLLIPLIFESSVDGTLKTHLIRLHSVKNTEITINGKRDGIKILRQVIILSLTATVLLFGIERIKKPANITSTTNNLLKALLKFVFFI